MVTEVKSKSFTKSKITRKYMLGLHGFPTQEQQIDCPKKIRFDVRLRPRRRHLQANKQKQFTYAKLLVHESPKSPIREPNAVPPWPIKIKIVRLVATIIRYISSIGGVVNVVVAVYGIVFYFKHLLQHFFSLTF